MFGKDAKNTKTLQNFNITQKMQEKENLYTSDLIKTFVSPAWTLEYCLAKNETLFPLILKLSSKLLAPEAYNELKKEIEQNPDNKACILIQTLFKKKISKTQLAYDLANQLEFATIDTEDKYTKYLFDAIRYASNF